MKKIDYIYFNVSDFFVCSCTPSSRNLDVVNLNETCNIIINNKHLLSVKYDDCSSFKLKDDSNNILIK